ncbi:MAG: hypothetical protein IPP40_08300 [bacterium]|nr:hypothetical protein [bacterium]
MESEVEIKASIYDCTKEFVAEEINTITTEKQRQASIYVFCLLVEFDQNLVNPLDTNQWLFYVATVNNLNLLGGQKSIGLSHLKRISNECKYESLKLTVDQALDNITSVS